MENFIAEIRMFSNNERIPSGWMLCDGRMLDPNRYRELFSILKTLYGGNGSTTFGIPNLTGRIPIGMGKSPVDGITRIPGEPSGVIGRTLNVTNIPPHNHVIQTVAAQGTEGAIAGNLFAQPEDAGGKAKNIYTKDTGAALVEMDKLTIGLSGSNVPVQNIQPVLGIVYAIALSGIYPSKG